MILTLQKFQCYEETQVEFPEGSITTLYGKNGIGKSTLLEALEWVLFGQTKNIAPWVEPKAKTTVTLQLQNPPISIIRTRNPGSLNIIFNQCHYTREEAQQLIEKLFNGPDLWKATSYIAQDEINYFLTASAKDKLSLLNRCAFGTQEGISFYLKRIDSRLSALKVDLKNTSHFYHRSAQEFNQRLNQSDITLGETCPSAQDLKDQEEQSLLISRQLEELYQERGLYEHYRRQRENFETEISKLSHQLQELKNQEPQWSDPPQSHSLPNFPSFLNWPLDQQETALDKDRQQLDQWEKEQSLLLRVESQQAYYHKKFQRLEGSGLELSIQLSDYYQGSLKVESVQEALKSYLESHFNDQVPFSGSISELLTLESRLIQQEKNYDHQKQICQEWKLDCQTSAIEEARRESQLVVDQTQDIQRQQERVRYRQQLSQKIKDLKAEPFVPAPQLQKIESLEPLVLPVFQPSLEVNSRPPSSVPFINDHQISSARVDYERCQQKYKELTCPNCQISLSLDQGELVLYETQIQAQDELNRLKEKYDSLCQARQEYQEYQQAYNHWESQINQIKHEKSQFDQRVQQIQAEYNQRKQKLVYEEELAHREYNHQLERHRHSLDRAKQLKELEEEWENLEAQGDQSHETFSLSELEFHRRRLQALNPLIWVELPKISSKVVSQLIELNQLMTDYEQWKEDNQLSSIDQIASLPQAVKEAQLNSWRTQLVNYMMKRQSYLQQKENLESQLAEVQEKLTQLKENPKRDPYPLIKELEAKRQTLESQIRRGQQEISLFEERNRIVDIYYQIHYLEQEKLELTKLRQLALRVECRMLGDIIDQINDYLAVTAEILYTDPIEISLQLEREIKTTSEIRSEVQLRIVHRGGHFNNYRKLSGGEKNKLSLLMTLALNSLTRTPFILFDEKFSSFDNAASAEIIDVLKECAPHKTIICINHNRLDSNYDQVIDVEKLTGRY